MSCYTRHLRDQIEAAGLPFDKPGKKEADRRIRAALGAPEDDCPDVWGRVKAMPRVELVDLLRKEKP